MNILNKKWAVILLMTAPLWSNAQQVIKLEDPSGKIRVDITLGNTITYSVLQDRKSVV